MEEEADVGMLGTSAAGVIVASSLELGEVAVARVAVVVGTLAETAGVAVT